MVNLGSLSARETPVGIKTLTVSLGGIGVVYLTAFVIYVATALGVFGANYGADPSNLSFYLIVDIVNYLLPALFALFASYALLSQKRIAKNLVIFYGIMALPGFHGMLNGHPLFLFAIIGAVVIFYMRQPHVREYFHFQQNE